MGLNVGMIQDLEWWISSAASFNGRPLQVSKWDLTIESDASLRGWGASSQLEDHGQQGNTKTISITWKMLGALKSLDREKEGIAILDNITGIAFINRMGGTHLVFLTDLAIEI